MDHTFSTTTGAIRQHHHHQHQQSVRNSLSPSPLNTYYRISPSPTNILTASATPTAISNLPYSNNKASPSPTGYQTASPQTVISPTNVSNLYRLQTLTVQQQQQQQQQLQQSQQLHQYIQQQIHHHQTPSNFVQTSAGSLENYGQGQARVSQQQYPLRQQNQSSSNIVKHQQQQQINRSVALQIQSNPQSQTLNSAYNHPASSSNTSCSNYSNLEHPYTRTQTQHHSQSQTHHQLQRQSPQQLHQFQTQVSQRGQTPPQTQHSHNQMPNSSQQQQQNMNKNRYLGNQQAQAQSPQVTINSNAGVSPSTTSSPLIHQQQSQQQQQPPPQAQVNNVNSIIMSTNNNNNGNAVSSSGNGNNSPPQTQQQQQQQPQYRIFKRGDSIPGISSPIQINSSQISPGNANENGTQQNPGGVLDTSTKNGTEGGTSNSNNSTDNQNGNDKENANTMSSPKSSNEGKGGSASAIRTPLSQIGEIARYHALHVEYRLVKETGPPHAPTFTVLLHLGKEEYTGQGPSIKKAQHAAAVEALEKTALSRPPPKQKPKKSFNPNSSGGNNKRPNWALIQLTNLAQELQLPLQFVQQPVPIVDPFRRGEPPSIVSVHVGERIFTGEGSNFNSAKNMAVMVALKAMIKVKQEMDLAKLVQAGTDAEQNMMEADNKSPISIVHEMAMKRSLNVAFEIVQETGPPHMKVFTVKCKVGEELETEGQGPTKQAAKKASSEAMIAKLKEIPIQLPATSQGLNLKAMQRGLMRQKLAKKKTSTPVVKDLEKQTVSPISRLIQICHIKKLKEPEFTLISTGTETNVESFLKQITERDRRMLRKKKPVFTIEVTVGPHTCRGTGPNKKAAKKAAAEAAVIALGYGPTEEISEKGESTSGKDGSAEGDKAASKGGASSTTGNNNSSGNASASDKPGSNSANTGSPSVSVKLAGARQIAPGIIVLKQEGAATGGTTSSAAAQEMKKVNTLMTSSSSSSSAAGQSSREGIEKLAYLSRLLDISVSYSDFPKKNEYLSVVSLTTNPPHVAHGCGTTLEEAQNAAALKILEELSTMDLDSVTAAAEKTSE